MKYVDALLVSRGGALPAETIAAARSPKRIDVAAKEEKVAQESYRHHQAVERAERELIAQLLGEQLPRGILLEDVVYFTGLGVLLENNVRGLIREWERPDAGASRLMAARDQVLGARLRMKAMR